MGTRSLSDPSGEDRVAPQRANRRGLAFTRSVAVVISRPRDEVFAFVADARNRPRWDDSVDSEELTSPEPIGVGTTVRTKLRSMGHDYAINWEVVEHHPPTA